MKRLATFLYSSAVSVALATPAHAATPPHPSDATCSLDQGPRTDSSTLHAGIGLTVSGVAIGLLVGAPALLMHRNARADASKATYEARQRRYARRARRREIVAVAALGTGGAFVLIGVPLMIAGARQRNSDRLTVTPVLSPTMAGLDATVRF
jgi:hypothetical protein